MVGFMSKDRELVLMTLHTFLFDKNNKLWIPAVVCAGTNGGQVTSQFRCVSQNGGSSREQRQKAAAARGKAKTQNAPRYSCTGTGTILARSTGKSYTVVLTVLATSS